MALGSFARSKFLLGVAVGAGAVILGPWAWRSSRPLAKAALRNGIAGYAAARVAVARATEEAEDLLAEVMYEAEQAAAAAEAAPAEADAAAPGSASAA